MFYPEHDAVEESATADAADQSVGLPELVCEFVDDGAVPVPDVDVVEGRYINAVRIAR